MIVNKFLKLAKKDLFPLCRSLTGAGTLKTLKIRLAKGLIFQLNDVRIIEKITLDYFSKLVKCTFSAFPL